MCQKERLKLAFRNWKDLLCLPPTHSNNESSTTSHLSSQKWCGFNRLMNPFHLLLKCKAITQIRKGLSQEH